MTIQDQITAAANSAGVPAWLALAIAQRESGFDNTRVGSKGEIGIFQLMPSTAAQLGVDPTDPVQNIAGGVAYIAQALRTFGGDAQKAAAAFNCGPTCVANAVNHGGANWASYIPASTQAYAAAVTGSPLVLYSSSGGLQVQPTPGLFPSASPDATAPAASPTQAGVLPSSSGIGTEWQQYAVGLGVVLTFLLLRGIGQRA